MLKSAFLILFTLTASVHAGTGVPGSASTSCQEFFELAQKMTQTLQIIRQDRIDPINPRIVAAELLLTAQNLPSCVSQGLADGLASVSPNGDPILLNGDLWQALSIEKRRRVVAHALCILAHYESPDDVHTSQDLLKILNLNEYSWTWNLACSDLTAEERSLVGIQCHTSRFCGGSECVFERGMEADTWIGPDGNLWTQDLGPMTNPGWIWPIHSRAERRCKKLGKNTRLPTQKDFVRAEAFGLSEVLRGSGKKYWSSTPHPQHGRYVYLFDGDDGSLEPGWRSTPYNVRCIREPRRTPIPQG